MERWKQRAITDIQLLEERERAADGLLVQIRELEADNVGVSGIDTRKVPVQGGGNAQERRLAAYLDRKTKLEAKERALRELAKHTRRVLGSLQLPERVVLTTLYCSGQRRGDAVCSLEFQLHMSRATIYRLRERALWNFAYGMGYIEENPDGT